MSAAQFTARRESVPRISFIRLSLTLFSLSASLYLLCSKSPSLTFRFSSFLFSSLFLLSLSLFFYFRIFSFTFFPIYFSLSYIFFILSYDETPACEAPCWVDVSWSEARTSPAQLVPAPTTIPHRERQRKSKKSKKNSFQRPLVVVPFSTPPPSIHTKPVGNRPEEDLQLNFFFEKVPCSF